MGNGLGSLDRLWTTGFGVTLACYPVWLVLQATPGIGFDSAFAWFGGFSVVMTALILRYRPAIRDHLFAFGIVTTVGFVVVGWVLWGDFGITTASWQIATERVVLYLTTATMAYLLTYRRWYALGKARLRLAVRRQSR